MNEGRLHTNTTQTVTQAQDSTRGHGAVMAANTTTVLEMLPLLLRKTFTFFFKVNLMLLQLTPHFKWGFTYILCS